ncbi:hypothetical protein chiPu_0009888 [Chiloscyllium punctatum]|uniref:Uncharacterized protein n=1 Tax=Chiloscyllium punctatum TaxID=137246 RepID=A0A401SM17_CHIPU|nr:hypothetical protein [Chiloscyllium punctatum]
MIGSRAHQSEERRRDRRRAVPQSAARRGGVLALGLNRVQAGSAVCVVAGFLDLERCLHRPSRRFRWRYFLKSERSLI